MAPKDLTIKAGKLKRIYKEYLSYQKERRDQEAKIKRMQDEGKDEYDIKKQREVLQETLTMIPDTRSRLTAAIKELEEYLNTVQDQDIKEAAEYKAALDSIEEAKAAFE
eukprot:TRINITY_DN1315_c0_g1::TRINITY_DN1315_c0_g1_i1::g.20032::m.20032 TRINITY_DN1315_c0_g1::TRINITY_DN1315_c0_g1_i1::g.20032  ORF type:complete len:109 (+),score=24.55,sp/P80584/TBCA_RABIT/45.00/2e-17,TBCA/PF02970.11/1.8e-26,DUF2333/PF10095.4/0.048,APG6/PF04111.7/0.095,DUF4404/PF14357.1/0.22,DUF342/PF03961.8/0.37,V_ATPase_I/PF01496.14/0.93,DUF4407/PF14362.1/1.3,IncA/PF04156.9/72,IncA/PF04156.9/25 TRINITY_DN1315_c0_g1_i1:102-428(+)